MMSLLELVKCCDNPNNFTREELGNKALNLMKLYGVQDKLGFIVPDFFVIPTSFYQDYHQRHGLAEKIKVYSLVDLQKLWLNENSLSPNCVPIQIKEHFESFFEDYRTLLEPAIDTLTGNQQHSEWRISFRRNYRGYYQQLNKGVTQKQMEALIKAFGERYTNFTADLERLYKLYDLITEPIYRSSSPLEDAEYPFSGVFESAVGGNNKDAGFILEYVLSSSYNPYAQFYMEKHGFKEFPRGLAVIVQRHIHPHFCGVIQVSDRKVIKYSEGVPGFTSFFVEMINGKITRYDNFDSKTTRDKYPFSNSNEKVKIEREKLSEKTLFRIADLVERVSEKLRFGDCSLEFVVDREDNIYLSSSNLSIRN